MSKVITVDDTQDSHLFQVSQGEREARLIQHVREVLATVEGLANAKRGENPLALGVLSFIVTLDTDDTLGVEVKCEVASVCNEVLAESCQLIAAKLVANTPNRKEQ